MANNPGKLEQDSTAAYDAFDDDEDRFTVIFKGDKDDESKASEDDDKFAEFRRAERRISKHRPQSSAFSNSSIRRKLTMKEVDVFRGLTWDIRHPNGKRSVPWPKGSIPKQDKFGDASIELATQYTYEWNSGKEGQIWCRAYEVEVNSFIALKYTIQFESIEDYALSGSFPMNSAGQIQVELQPFERETICVISRDLRKTKGSQNKLKVTGDWKRCEIADAVYKSSLAISANKFSLDILK